MPRHASSLRFGRRLGAVVVYTLYMFSMAKSLRGGSLYATIPPFTFTLAFTFT